MSGTEFKRVQEAQADIMRQKQQAGMFMILVQGFALSFQRVLVLTYVYIALEKKSEEKGGKAK